MASPRLRGWTSGRVGGDLLGLGFPAPAGMDPDYATPDAAPRRLPRACGDGPGAGTGIDDARVASPRLRGWTFIPGMRWAAIAGFPAPAGMDPPARAPSAPSPRLPRACGDGPRLSASYILRREASPRLRGWTHWRPMRGWRPPGFPAPAGMDRPLRSRARRRSRLPRACGDGPRPRATTRRPSSASPRLRGWTRNGFVFSRGCAGFPAPAGMDLIRPFAVRTHRRLPRACGDGPRGWDGDRDFVRASPRLRGWTRPCPAEIQPAEGFPAPAGMDPLFSRSVRGRTWLPRACGDGPGRVRHVPRFVGASPRLRGWTVLGGRGGRGAVGFPAPAGMDRSRTRAAGRSRWLPRACGDGPSMRLSEELRDAASPRLRGWTRSACLELRRRLGFPAPAGMDPCSRPCGVT